jgi:hypothetical protein
MSALASVSLDAAAARLSWRSRAGACAALAAAARRPAFGAAPPAGRPLSTYAAAAGDLAGGSIDDDRDSLARAFASGASGITGEELKVRREEGKEGGILINPTTTPLTAHDLSKLAGADLRQVLPLLRRPPPAARRQDAGESSCFLALPVEAENSQPTHRQPPI